MYQKYSLWTQIECFICIFFVFLWWGLKYSQVSSNLELLNPDEYETLTVRSLYGIAYTLIIISLYAVLTHQIEKNEFVIIS